MATLEQVLAGMIEFRDMVYSRFDAIESKLDNFEMINFNLCTMCHGSGQITPSYDTNQQPPSPITCPSCNGLGKVALGSSVEKY